MLDVINIFNRQTQIFLKLEKYEKYEVYIAATLSMMGMTALGWVTSSSYLTTSTLPGRCRARCSASRRSRS